jgi:hypothetical protein
MKMQLLGVMRPISIILIILFMAACSSQDVVARDKKQDQVDGSIDEITDSVKKMGESLAAQSKIQPVDYQDLKKLLPRKLRGMKQVDVQGGRNSMFGIRLTHAEAEFEGKKDAMMTVKITDFGTVKGLVGKAMLAWMSAEIDNDSDKGFERTVEHKGHKGFQKYNYNKKEGKFSIIIAKRFLVEVEGENVSMKSIIKGMNSVKLKKLAKLKNYGVPKRK